MLTILGIHYSGMIWFILAMIAAMLVFIGVLLGLKIQERRMMKRIRRWSTSGGMMAVHPTVDMTILCSCGKTIKVPATASFVPSQEDETPKKESAPGRFLGEL